MSAAMRSSRNGRMGIILACIRSTICSALLKWTRAKFRRFRCPLDFRGRVGLRPRMKPNCIAAVVVAALLTCRGEVKIETLAGTGVAGFSGDGGLGLKAKRHMRY